VGQQGYSCASECTRDAGENPRSDAVATRLSGRRFPGERDAASSALSHRIVVGLGPCGEISSEDLIMRNVVCDFNCGACRWYLVVQFLFADADVGIHILFGLLV